MNPTLNPEDYDVVDSRRLDTRNLCDTIGFEKTQELLKSIATVITEAVQMCSGKEKMSIVFRNILERDSNPGGFRPFFEVIDMGGRELINVNVIQIKQVPGGDIPIG